MMSTAWAWIDGSLAASACGLKNGCRILRNRVCSGGSNAAGTKGSGLPTNSNAFLEENTFGLRNAAITSSLRVSAYQPSLNTTGPASRKAAHPVPRS